MMIDNLVLHAVKKSLSGRLSFDSIRLGFGRLKLYLTQLHKFRQISSTQGLLLLSG